MFSKYIESFKKLVSAKFGKECEDITGVSWYIIMLFMGIYKNWSSDIEKLKIIKVTK